MPQKMSPKVLKKRLEASDKQAKAVDLYLQGWSYRRIAAKLGYSGPSSVKQAIDGAIAKAPSRAVGALREEVDERSRMLLEQLMPMVENPRVSMEERLQAIDRVIKVDKELRALHGLDAPKKMELAAELTTAPSPAEAARLIREAFGDHAAKKNVEAEDSRNAGDIPEAAPAE